MYFSLIGLVFDIIGASLLITGEILGSAALLAYWATGEQQDNYRKRWRTFPTWKRWALEAGSKLGSHQHLGQEALEDSFPVKFVGFILLILGFALQFIGVIIAR